MAEASTSSSNGSIICGNKSTGSLATLTLRVSKACCSISVHLQSTPFFIRSCSGHASLENPLMDQR